MTWTETRPGAWTAPLGEGRLELLLVGGEVTAWWWRDGVVVELDLGAERAGVLIVEAQPAVVTAAPTAGSPRPASRPRTPSPTRTLGGGDGDDSNGSAAVHMVLHGARSQAWCRCFAAMPHPACAPSCEMLVTLAPDQLEPHAGHFVSGSAESGFAATSMGAPPRSR